MKVYTLVYGEKVNTFLGGRLAKFVPIRTANIKTSTAYLTDRYFTNERGVYD